MARKLTTTTMYDMDCLEELQQVVSKYFDGSVARRERLVGAVWAVFAFGASVVAQQAGLHPAIVALLFVIGLYFGARVLRVYRSMARKSYMDMDKNAVRNDYTMDASHIIAENATGSAKYPYSHCARLLETEQRFYVILKEGQGIVLDKEQVSGGSAEDLRRLLESRCGKSAEKVHFGLLSRLKLPKVKPPRLS